MSRRRKQLRGKRHLGAVPLPTADPPTSLGHFGWQHWPGNADLGQGAGTLRLSLLASLPPGEMGIVPVPSIAVVVAENGPGPGGIFPGS